jgi:6-pyruvoyltetrahydropterin/6-carboxytetrahydropterin synthase
VEKRILLTKSYPLPALHTLAGEGFSEAENLEVFGPCSRLHGHDYRIEATVSGPVDHASGLVINRDVLDGAVKKHLLEPFVGTNLSDHFQHTTGEALAVEFFEILKVCLPADVVLVRIRLHETAKNSFIAGD